MKRLCELVEIGINNEECVLFDVKEDKTVKRDLISLGCFRGNETMIRMTKGRQPEITVWYQDGKSWSYHFGEGSTTGLNENGIKQRQMIRECAVLDFGIVCDCSYMSSPNKDRDRIAATTYVTSLEDADRVVSLVSGGGMTGHLKINGQIVAHDVHVKDAGKWFRERGYMVEFESPIDKGLDCGEVLGKCWRLEPVQEEILEAQVGQEKGYTKKQLLGAIEGYGRMIDRDNGEHPEVVLDDIRKSVGYVLEMNKAGKAPTFAVSASKLVAFVQERLGCDEKDAIGFIREYDGIVERERYINLAYGLIDNFREEIDEAIPGPVRLSDNALAEIGRKIGRNLDFAGIDASTADMYAVCNVLIQLIREQKQHTVGELLESARDVCENVNKGNNSKVDVDLGK